MNDARREAVDAVLNDPNMLTDRDQIEAGFDAGAASKDAALREVRETVEWWHEKQIITTSVAGTILRKLDRALEGVSR